MGRGSDRILSIIFEIAENILLLEVIADLNRSTTRTLRARATKIIPPHEIEFLEGFVHFHNGMARLHSENTINRRRFGSEL